MQVLHIYILYIFYFDVTFALSFSRSTLQVVHCSKYILGGKSHTDIWGITYQSDPLEGRVGVASDYGRRFLIGRVPPDDQILYQTERYNLGNFEYSFRIPGDGDFVVVLKFSEVYFSAVHEKVLLFE